MHCVKGKIDNMAEASEDSGSKIKITVKTPKEKKDVEVSGEGTIKEVIL